MLRVPPEFRRNMGNLCTLAVLGPVLYAYCMNLLREQNIFTGSLYRTIA